MDFGMFTDFHVRGSMTQAQAFEESFNQVMEAERMGMDSVWLAEHHFTPDRSVLASPLVIASAIAARTSTLRVGLAVQVLPLTNPLRVAEEAATVDHISQGRFEFGIGRSGLTKYYEGYNVPYAESRGRFFEALQVVMKAWQGAASPTKGTSTRTTMSRLCLSPSSSPTRRPVSPLHRRIPSPWWAGWATTFSSAQRRGFPC